VPYQSSSVSNNNATPASRLADRATLLLAACWIVFVGISIWLHAAQSTQPPVYDAFTYYFKAKSVWDQASLRHPYSLLNVAPSFRPPATVLMSYPLGFSEDFRPFYFRSVFFPVLLLFGASLVALTRPKPVGAALRYAALMAVFLPTVSLFYYFEPYDDGPPLASYWGLVDSFLAGVAALAAAAAVRSLSHLSLRWAIAATVLSALGIFIKPTGAPLAAIIGAFATAGWLWRLARTPAPRPKAAIKRLLVQLATQVVLLGGAVWCATHSDYLGNANMAYGKNAIVVMRAELGIGLVTLLHVVLGGVGPFWLAWFLISLGALVKAGLFRRRDIAPNDAYCLISAALILIIGLWFWLYGSGAPTTFRYFLPFLLIASICAIGPLHRLLLRSSAVLRWTLAALMSASIVNLSLLLLVDHPDLRWQLLSGVNVAAGTRQPSIEQARQVIASTPADRPSVTVYALTPGSSDAMFESIFDMHQLRGSTTRFTVRRPFDWVRPSAFRIEEIASSDFLVFDPVQSTGFDSSTHNILDYYQERATFTDWAARLTPKDGVQVVSVEPGSTLLKVVDVAALRNSLTALVNAHQWPAVFNDSNQPAWWSEDQVSQALKAAQFTATDLNFENLFQMRGPILELPSANTVNLMLWLRRDVARTGPGWLLLVHVLDGHGTIVAQHDLAISAAAAPTGLPYWYTQTSFSLPPNAARIAIGIYRGKQILESDGARRDWNGKRTLLDLPAPHR
jgi:hypothetical protein